MEANAILDTVKRRTKNKVTKENLAAAVLVAATCGLGGFVTFVVFQALQNRTVTGL